MRLIAAGTRLFLFTLLLLLFPAGCGTFQVVVEEGTPPAGRTTRVAPAASGAAATSTSAPTETSTRRATQAVVVGSPEAGATEPSAIFYDAHTGFLLGGFTAGGWVSPTTIAPTAPDGRRYQLYAGGSRIAQATGTVETIDSPICSGFTLDFSREPAAAWALAVSGATWDLTPYPPTAVTLGDEQQEAVEALLRARGLHVEPGTLGVLQALQVDLEGDGQTETVVTARRLERDGRMPPVAADDYALVVLLRADGEVQPIRLDLYPEAVTLAYPWWYEVVAILDLNGDGRQELVVAATRYEGRQTVVYAPGPDGEAAFAPVLVAGCTPERAAVADENPRSAPLPTTPVTGGAPAGSGSGSLPVPPVPPTPVPTPGAHISEFSVEPATATPGDTVTVSWEASGESARLCLQSYTVGGQLATHNCEGVPLSDSRPYPLDPLYRSRVVLALEVYSPDDEMANASLPLQFTCPDDWWFIPNPPDVCPGTEPFNSAAAAQFFEGGQMIWIGDLDTFYILFADGSYRTYYGPLPTAGETPEPAPPPEGLHAPVSGFGLLWYGQVPRSDGLRARLGWALGPEFAFEAVWQVEARPERARTFLQGPDEILVLRYDRRWWGVWE